MPSTSFFKKIETKQKVEAPAKGEGKVIKVSDNSIFESVRQLAKVKEQIASLTALQKSLDVDVRDRIEDEFGGLYEKETENPGTVNVEFTNTKNEKATVMFIPTDSYCKLKPGDAERLTKTFGADIIDNKEKITLDTKLFNKYEAVIAKWLETTKDITAEDKANLIQFDNVTCVKKGTDSMLMKYAKKAKMSVKEVMKQIQMTCQIKKVTLNVENPVVTPSKKTSTQKTSA